jgi:hypothetical protein
MDQSSFTASDSGGFFDAFLYNGTGLGLALTVGRRRTRGAGRTTRRHARYTTGRSIAAAAGRASTTWWQPSPTSTSAWLRLKTILILRGGGIRLVSKIRTISHARWYLHTSFTFFVFDWVTHSLPAAGRRLGRSEIMLEQLRVSSKDSFELQDS